MKRSLFAIAVLAAASMSMAQTQPIQGGTITGDGGKIDNQLMGDTSVVNDHSQSSAVQTGNSANAVGNDLANQNDVRNQNTVNAPATATGGTANGNQSDNKSTASVGQANTGNSSATTGASTSSTGAIDNSSKATTGASTSNAQGGGGGGGGGGGTGVGVGLGGEGGKATGGTVAGSGNSKQGQGQQQGIAGSGNSRNSQSTSAGNGAGAGAGSGNQTTLQANDQSRTQVWANPVVHGAGAAAVPSANLIQQKGQCGPRVRVVSTQVIGIRFGFFGGQSEVNLGYTDKLGPYLNEDGTPGDLFVVDKTTGWLTGHQYDTIAGMQSVSSANSISLGAFSGGDAAQGGVASSGGMQTIGVKIIVGPCVMPVKTEPAPPAVRPTIHVEKPIRE